MTTSLPRVPTTSPSSTHLQSSPATTADEQSALAEGDRWRRHRDALQAVVPLLQAGEQEEQARRTVARAPVPDVGFLHAHGLLGLWWHGPLREQLRGWPDDSAIRHLLVRESLHRAAQGRALERIAGAFTEARLRWLVLKSAGYRDELYPCADMRVSTDVDLLVDSHDLDHALRLLERLGARALSPGSGHERPFRFDAVDVDLHWDVLAPGRLPRKWVTGLLERRVRRGDLWRPDDTDTLLLALVHPAFAKHVCSRHMGLNRVADTLLLLRRFRFSPAELRQRLDAAGVRRAAWASACWAQRLSPVAVPELERLLAQLAPSAPMRRYIETWIDRDWPDRWVERHPIINQLGLLLWLHDGSAHRARVIGCAAWRGIRRAGR